MVFAATELGIGVVQEIITATLKQKPGMSLRDFTHILDNYIQQQRDSAKNSIL
tara:strand:+ start:604 stop:762 length:159 start_codon:yes stop_codon:yes gene_type:complete